MHLVLWNIQIRNLVYTGIDDTIILVSLGLLPFDRYSISFQIEYLIPNIN